VENDILRIIDKATAAAVSSAAANADAFAAGIPLLSKILILSNILSKIYTVNDTFIKGDFLIASFLFMKSLAGSYQFQPYAISICPKHVLKKIAVTKMHGLERIHKDIFRGRSCTRVLWKLVKLVCIHACVLF
jgi:hypothetical protein